MVVSVLMSLNFEMSQHMIFPTKQREAKQFTHNDNCARSGQDIIMRSGQKMDDSAQFLP